MIGSPHKELHEKARAKTHEKQVHKIEAQKDVIIFPTNVKKVKSTPPTKEQHMNDMFDKHGNICAVYYHDTYKRLPLEKQLEVYTLLCRELGDAFYLSLLPGRLLVEAIGAATMKRVAASNRTKTDASVRHWYHSKISEVCDFIRGLMETEDADAKTH